MSIYRDLVISETAKNRKYGKTEIPFSFSPKLGSVANTIQQAKYYTIGGRDSSGKRSFTDLHFVLNAYMWWAQMPEPRPKLKILYFSMNKNLKVKLQKWLCTYMWIYFNKLIDINTLNGTQGKMYDLNDVTLKQIEDSQAFFDYFLETSDVIDIYEGTINPTGIFSQVVQYMRTVGNIKTEEYKKEFIYDPGYQEQITLVIVDSVHHMKNESKSGEFYNEGELHKKFNEYLVELRDIYKVSPVVMVPSFQVPGVYKLNQMKPDFREFRQYYEDSDMVLHLMNPFKLQIESYEGYEMKKFISPFDIVARFRVVSILRNADGRESIQIPLWFIPENGIIYDLPSLQDPTLQSVIDYIQTFKNQQITNILAGY